MLSEQQMFHSTIDNSIITFIGDDIGAIEMCLFGRALARTLARLLFLSAHRVA